MVQGLSEEDPVDDQDRGPLAYQESKVFNTESHLLNVFDHKVKKRVTFEVYGLDTQDVLFLQYDYGDFDALFRFNAELMNPNRKDGRFHWIIERLEIAILGAGTANAERKLRLAPEPTKEVPELPIYENDRKIPTGRMDLKERQRLREQMDMLNVKREENIQKKRAAAKERFLEKVFLLKEEAVRKEKQVADKIAEELKERHAYKEEVERQEAEDEARLEAMAKIRMHHEDVKEERTEEAEEEELRTMRARWKANDARKAQLIKDAHARKLEDRAKEKVDRDAEEKRLAVAQEKREANWARRDKNVKSKQEALVAKALAPLEKIMRDKKIMEEKHQEQIREKRSWNEGEGKYEGILIEERQPIFEAQMRRSVEREAEAEAEKAKISEYHENRALEKKVKSKGKNAQTPAAKAKAKGKAKDKAKAKGKAKAKATAKASDSEDPSDHEKTTKPATAESGNEEDNPAKNSDKANKERLVDEIEIKMRKEMELQKMRQSLEKVRSKVVEEKEAARKEKEAARNQAYREQKREETMEFEKQASERRIVIKQAEEERIQADERKKQEMARLVKVRKENIDRIEEKRQAALMA